MHSAQTAPLLSPNVQFRDLRNHIFGTRLGCGEAARFSVWGATPGVVGSPSHPPGLSPVPLLCTLLFLNPKCPFLSSQELKFYISLKTRLKMSPTHSKPTLQYFFSIVNYSNLRYIHNPSISPYICIFIILLFSSFLFYNDHLVFWQGRELCKKNALVFKAKVLLTGLKTLSKYSSNE